MDQPTFGKCIRLARESMGMSIQSLASRADITGTYVSQLERDVQPPGIDTALTLAQVLGLPANLVLHATGRLMEEEMDAAVAKLAALVAGRHGRGGKQKP